MKVSDGAIENGLEISRGEIVEVGLNGVVNDTTVLSGGTLSLLDGSYAAATDVKGKMYIDTGAVADNTTVLSGGTLSLLDGSYAATTAVKGKMYIYTGAVADDITVTGELYVKGGTVQNVDVEDYASMTVSSGAAVNGINVSYEGALSVEAGAVVTGLIVDEEAKIDITVSRESQISGSCGGREFTVCDGVAENITISYEIESKLVVSAGVEAIGTVALPFGELVAKSGCRVINTEIRTQAYFTLSAGAVAENSSFGSSSTVYFYGSHRGTLSIDKYSYFIFGADASVDFTVAGRTVSDDYLITNIDKLENTPAFTMTVSAFQAGGTYKLATVASDFDQNVTIGDGRSVYGVLTVNGEAVDYGTRSFKLVCDDNGNLMLDVVSNGSDNFNSAQWEEVEAAEGYLIEYSKNNFATAIRIVSETNALNTAGLAAGTYQWRVKAAGSDEWTICEDIVIAGEPDDAQLYEASDDGKKDIFFASVNGKWRASHKAQHSGTIEFGNLSWEGTNEVVRLSNKGKIVDCFAGAGEDANTLYLTDNSNGDALFVDDIFSELPDSVTGQARIAQIREICGGAGDDLIDMTSQRFFYTGSGVVIRGGDGNDTVWANKGENILLGDAGADRLVGAGGNDVLAGGSGNDSMHGGGGDDIFAFCADWGRDTIEQLASGSVTLWFENEMELSFDESTAGTLISTADGSSILVKNMSVSLDDCRFCSVGFENEFAVLSNAGAFEEYSSNKIFTITA